MTVPPRASGPRQGTRQARGLRRSRSIENCPHRDAFPAHRNNALRETKVARSSHRWRATFGSIYAVIDKKSPRGPLSRTMPLVR